MSDFDSFRREVGSQVIPPDFDDVVAVGRRRRLAAVGWSAVSVAAVVGVAALGVQNGYDASPPVVPANQTHSSSDGTTPPSSHDTPPTTNPAPVQHRLSASQVVNDPTSYLAAVAVSDSSPDVKAVAWRYCIDGVRHCNQAQFALTVTVDDFATSSDVDLPGRSFPVIVAVGPDTFYAAAGDQALLIGTDGSSTPVHIDTAARPLAAGEVFVGHTDSLNPGYLAVDASKALAHPVPLPPMTRSESLSSFKRNADGTLVGVVQGLSNGAVLSRVVSSRDGGGTWGSHSLPVAAENLVEVIPSLAANVIAVVRGGDSATLFPFDTVYRSADGGVSWQTLDESPGRDMAYLGWSLVEPDGRLLVDIEAWSDAPPGPVKHLVGLFESDGANWSNLRYVLPDMPDPGAGLALGSYSATSAGNLQVWVYDSSHGRLYQSGPGLKTWAEVTAR